MNVREAMTSAKAHLSRLEISAPALEAQLLVAHVLGVERVFLFAHPEAEVPIFALEHVLQRREGNEPLAHILGFREFYGHRFLVNRSVLIPRQETELLVETVLTKLEAGAKILDVGTGSGCIAISIALARPDCVVHATDISASALTVARQNAEDLGCAVTFFEGDLVGAVTTTYDVIVSNPPYIASGDPLPHEVRDYEPNLALFGGDDGLELYRRLATDASRALVSEGFLILELGAGQSAEVTSIFEQAGWNVVEVRHDLALHPRCLVAQPHYSLSLTQSS